MDQERARTEAAIKRAADGDPGKPHTAQRLEWVLQGAAGWRIRAIQQEERFLRPGSGITHQAVAGGKVRYILATYLRDLEKSMIDHKFGIKPTARQLGRKLLEHAATVQSWMTEIEADLGDMEDLRDALVELSGYDHEEMLGLVE